PLPGRRPVEGLYFLRSDCDNPLIAAAGNLLTDFRFHTARVRVTENGPEVAIDVDSAQSPASLRLHRSAPPELPPGSPFAAVDERAAGLKSPPFGISVDPGSWTASVVRIGRDESAWRARPVTVERARWAFLQNKEARLELAYEVEPIPYQWNRGQ